jgi:GNAT superfamily N-acetyltransferase
VARLPTREELPQAALVLARAFEHDAVLSQLLPERGSRVDRLRRYFELEAEGAISRGGEVWVDDDLRGAAVWRPPGGWVDPTLTQLGRLPGYLATFRGRFRVASRLATTLARVHPVEPHWYLPCVGVEPGAMGRGVGTAMLQPVVERCDREGFGAYLEATSAASARLFSRLGFEPREDVEVLARVSVTLMWRPPRH